MRVGCASLRSAEASNRFASSIDCRCVRSTPNVSTSCRDWPLRHSFHDAIQELTKIASVSGVGPRDSETLLLEFFSVDFNEVVQQKISQTAPSIVVKWINVTC